MTGAAEFHRHDVWTQKAVDLLSSPQARKAFNLDEEPAHVRDRYGRHRFGQSVLLARRLVEASVSLVQVNWTRDKDGTNDSPMWDTHQRNAELLKTRLDAADGRRLFRADRRPRRARPAWTRRWSSGWASSAARPRSTAVAGATIGAMCFPWRWPAAAFRAALSMVPPTGKAASRERGWCDPRM